MGLHFYPHPLIFTLQHKQYSNQKLTLNWISNWISELTRADSEITFWLCTVPSSIAVSMYVETQRIQSLTEKSWKHSLWVWTARWIIYITHKMRSVASNFSLLSCSYAPRLLSHSSQVETSLKVPEEILYTQFVDFASDWAATLSVKRVSPSST